MANTKTQAGRSEARSTATGTAPSGSTGKTRPAPRQEEQGGTDAAAAPEIQPTKLVVVAPNPKRKGSIAFGFYEKYGPLHQLTTADECKARGVRGKDLTWDAQRMHILTDDPSQNITHASDFAALKTREERAEFLKGIGVSEANLIKWGYMDKPQPVEAETKAPAEANA